MHALQTYFDLFLHRIQPEAERANTAKEMPGAVRDYLKKHQKLTTVDPHTRLGGSYGRDTANGRIKDVDMLLFVHPDWRKDIPGLLRTLESSLRALPEALEDSGAVTLRRQRRSVNVELNDHDLSLDVVPVLLPSDGDIYGKLEVPDREWERWVHTQPLGYASFLSQINADHEQKVVRIVKMLKHWRDTHFERRRPKSYWLESLLVQQIRRDWLTTADKGMGVIFADLLDSVYERFLLVQVEEGKTPHIPDAMLRNNVAWNWERSHFDTFMRRLEESKSWARRAVTTDEQAQAIELWQRVFGDTFPSAADVNAEAKMLGNGARVGALLVTQSGAVSARPGPDASTVLAPPTRFFGKTE